MESNNTGFIYTNAFHHKLFANQLFLFYSSAILHTPSKTTENNVISKLQILCFVSNYS